MMYDNDGYGNDGQGAILPDESCGSAADDQVHCENITYRPDIEAVTLVV
jgi:hypothetical protein